MRSCSDQRNSLEGRNFKEEINGEREATAQSGPVQADARALSAKQESRAKHSDEPAATATSGKEMSSVDRWNLLFQVQASQLYHARRCAFYERLAKASDFMSIIGASTALTAIGSYFPKWIGVVGAFLALIASSLVLVIGAASMAHRHDNLRRRFCELEAKIQEEIDASPAKVGRWKRDRVAIEVDEPPTYWALSVLCERELARTLGSDDPEKYALPWYKAITANIFLWRNS